MRIIEASEGMTFRRIVDGRIIAPKIYLGVDHSTGVPREDLPEYYEEVVDTETVKQIAE